MTPAAQQLFEMKQAAKGLLDLLESIPPGTTPPEEQLENALSLLEDINMPILDTLYPPLTQEEDDAFQQHLQAQLLTLGLNDLVTKITKRARRVARYIAERAPPSIFNRPDGTGSAQLLVAAAHELAARAPRVIQKFNPDQPVDPELT